MIKDKNIKKNRLSHLLGICSSMKDVFLPKHVASVKDSIIDDVLDVFNTPSYFSHHYDKVNMRGDCLLFSKHVRNATNQAYKEFKINSQNGKKSPAKRG
ncbi:MAG: hypothetical protein LBF62_02085 [Tannerellaceae bacterium]|jgi:predicted nuclease of restriction endonuclease-like RecB superfamily|nr:hypothetical protein [Tannerellaceae bacterium]